MPQGNAIELFGTRSDLLSLFDLVEAPERLTYAQTGLFEETIVRLYASGKDIPNLGVSNLGEASTEPAYLVLAARQQVNVRPVAQRSGGVVYAVDQQWNPDTVVLKPGGVYRDECVIAGRLATISTTSAARELWALFAKALRQTFAKHGAYWLGSEAYDLWKKGVRLTIGARVSSRFDLR